MSSQAVLPGCSATCASINDGDFTFEVVDFFVPPAPNTHGHHGCKCPDRWADSMIESFESLEHWLSVVVGSISTI